MELIKRGAICFLVVSMVSGCTLNGNYMTPQNPAPKYHINNQLVRTNFIPLTPSYVSAHSEIPPYRVGPYDILNIIVWDHPELTTPTTELATPGESGFLVNAEGYMNFPFAGRLKVGGLRLSQIERLIGQHISKYIVNPQITVRVATFRSEEVQVMGEVGSQRTVPITDKPLSLLDAINAPNAGGTSVTTADTSHIYVIRGSVDQLTVFALDAKSPQAMMAAQRFYLTTNDIVYVPATPVTNWDRVLNQLLPSFGAVFTGQAIVNLTK